MSEPDAQERLLELFDQASALAPQEQQRFLAQLGQSEPDLAREVASLLAFAPGARERFDEPALARLGPDPGGSGGSADPADDPDDPERFPSRLGPFRLLREIGRGGMGRVFLAIEERAAFERRVALKLADRPWLAPDRLGRLREEIRILAALEHPGIARFLDGGALPDGTWYLALEYVEGEDLLTHATGLALAERLRLFRGVLEAVAYAHERGVVHRDLKPSNILVGPDGRPRLLDFGVAKLLEEEPDSGVRTEHRAFTPAYASPEQFLGEPVRPSSDVYSAGALLYELLCGARPHQHAGSTRATLERAVLSTAPVAPSRRSRAAGGPQTPGRDLVGRPGIGRDLDAICLKALRREPAARYADAREMALDLDRHLAGLPVHARRGGALDRASRLARRYRTPLLSAAAAVALLTLGWGLAERGRPQDSSSGRLADPPPPPGRGAPLPEIGELSARFAASPGRPELGLALVEALLARGRGEEAMTAIERLRQIPNPGALALPVAVAEAEAALAVSELQRAAHVAGNAAAAALRQGEPALALRARQTQAEALLRFSPPAEAEARCVQLFADAEAAGEPGIAARALLARAQAARRGARAEEAAALVAQALARFRALGDRAGEAEALTWRARFEGEAGELATGLASLDEALGIARELGHLEREGAALATRSALLNWRGDDAAGEQAALESVRKLRLSGNRELLLTQLTNLALSRVEQSDFAAAAALVAEAEALSRVVGNPAQRGSVLRARGYLEESRGDHDAARSSYEGAALAAREAGATEALATYLADLAWLELNADRAAPAATAASEASRLFRLGGDERSAVQADCVLAWSDARRGDTVAADRRLAAIDRQAEAMDADTLRYSLLLIRAELAQLAGDWPRVAALRRETAAMAADFTSPGLVLAQRLQLAEALARAGAGAEAAALARELLGDAERLGREDIARACRTVLQAGG